MTGVARSRFEIAVGTLEATCEALAIGVELLEPNTPRALLVCVPGGGMQRGYYDLPGRYGFAEALAARGYAVAMLDPLGVGTSSRPADGFLLHPFVEARAIATAARTLADRLGVPCIGVGHSMGGMLVSLALTEADAPFRALVLLGAGPVGLDWSINDEERAFVDDPAGLVDAVEGLARKRYDAGYQTLSPRQNRAIIYGGKGDAEPVAALKDVAAPMLATCAVFATVPRAWAPQAAQIAVPLFLAVGELDMLGGHDLPRWFPASQDISLLMLPGTGHTHFVFPTVDRLFARIAAWLPMVLETPE